MAEKLRRETKIENLVDNERSTTIYQLFIYTSSF